MAEAAVNAVWRTVVGNESAWTARDASVAVRAARPDDAVALYAVRSTPESQKYISRVMHSAQQERELIEQQRADEHVVRCVIEADGHVIGDIGGRFLRAESLDEPPRQWDFHLGYAVHPRWWGRGIATAAVGLFTPLLQERFVVRRVVAKVFEDNMASARVLEKAGFRLEGTEIAAVLGRDGSWLNDCTYALLS